MAGPRLRLLCSGLEPPCYVERDTGTTVVAEVTVDHAATYRVEVFTPTDTLVWEGRLEPGTRQLDLGRAYPPPMGCAWARGYLYEVTDYGMVLLDTDSRDRFVCDYELRRDLVNTTAAAAFILIIAWFLAGPRLMEIWARSRVLEKGIIE